jgi:hypothetical protein
MSGAVLPLPQYNFMALCLVKHRDNFTFTLVVLYGCGTWSLTLMKEYKLQMSGNRILKDMYESKKN